MNLGCLIARLMVCVDRYPRTIRGRLKPTILAAIEPPLVQLAQWTPCEFIVSTELLRCHPHARLRAQSSPPLQ